MKLAIYDDNQLGSVDDKTGMITPLTAPPGSGDPNTLGAGWWVRLCRDLQSGKARLAPIAAPMPLSAVTLRAAALNPGKVIACASNYAAHIAEMRDHVLPRTGSSTDPALLDFDIFLKAPSSIVGPGAAIEVPTEALRAGQEVHHEGELAVVIGRGGRDIPAARAPAHVLGYVIALDITVRGAGDRSRRKSHPTFTPLGPWLTTADEVPDWSALTIDLTVNGRPRQHVTVGDMLVGIPDIVAHASRALGLQPGDLILTGAPPGVGPIHPGDTVDIVINGLGALRHPVVAQNTWEANSPDAV
jgi:2-keto-4-pentenoate hydratase/2-oxohepta-3-ene-1,7-dioic acid hydratase in catechol pathway